LRIEEIPVVQVKKAAVREAILAAAYKLFCQRGYNGSTIAQIAREAGVSTANFYSYFNSKIEVLYTVYDPWLRERLELLEQELDTIGDSRLRLCKILHVLWRDIPQESNGFSNNIMQAISGLSQTDRYDPSPLLWYEAKVGQMILQALPTPRRSKIDIFAIAHMIFMMFDGFAVSAHANQRAACTKEIVEQFADFLLGETARGSGRTGISSSRKAARVERMTA
jgi:AcrR family transcriptional regulator